jgi:hypothetical protein
VRQRRAICERAYEYSVEGRERRRRTYSARFVSLEIYKGKLAEEGSVVLLRQLVLPA